MLVCVLVVPCVGCCCLYVCLFVVARGCYFPFVVFDYVLNGVVCLFVVARGCYLFPFVVFDSVLNGVVCFRVVFVTLFVFALFVNCVFFVLCVLRRFFLCVL